MHWKDLVESIRTPPRGNSPGGAGLSRTRASQALLPTSGDASPRRAEVGLPTDEAAPEHRKASRAATPNLFGHRRRPVRIQPTSMKTSLKTAWQHDTGRRKPGSSLGTRHYYRFQFRGDSESQIFFSGSSCQPQRSSGDWPHFYGQSAGRRGGGVRHPLSKSLLMAVFRLLWFTMGPVMQAF